MMQPNDWIEIFEEIEARRADLITRLAAQIAAGPGSAAQKRARLAQQIARVTEGKSLRQCHPIDAAAVRQRAAAALANVQALA